MIEHFCMTHLRKNHATRFWRNYGVEHQALAFSDVEQLYPDGQRIAFLNKTLSIKQGHCEALLGTAMKIFVLKLQIRTVSTCTLCQYVVQYYDFCDTFNYLASLIDHLVAIDKVCVVFSEEIAGAVLLLILWDS